MLPADNRMRRSAQFRAVITSGARARRGCVVVHHLSPASPGPTDNAAVNRPGHPIVGLVVGRAVGSSVVRHQVSRRLRAQLTARLARLPQSSSTVVRALPAAAGADSATIARDLDSALARVMRP